MRTEAQIMEKSLPQSKTAVSSVVKVNWGWDEDRSKPIIQNPPRSHSQANDHFTSVIIDSFNEDRVHNYYTNFDSFFDVPKDKRSGKMERLPMNPVNAVCRFTKSSILVNGIHDKSQGTFEIELDTLNAIRQVNDLIVSDMVVCGGMLVTARGATKTGVASPGAEIVIYSLEEGSESKVIYQSTALSQKTFYESFFPKSRIFSMCSSKPQVAYISQNNELMVLTINKDTIRELSVAIPEVNHVAVVGNSFKCITTQGGLYTYTVSLGQLASQRETLIESDKGSFFTCIGASTRHTVTASVNKTSMQIEIYLLRTAKDIILDKKTYTDSKKIFPVNQIQLLKKGPFTNVIVSELYERFSVYVVKQDKLMALNEREKFVMECIYGISFYEKHKEVTTIIYGNSFFKKVSL